MLKKVEICIQSVAGKCPQEFKAGDRWTVVDGKTPQNFCASAFHSLYPDLLMLQTGGGYPWAENKNSVVVSCPDAANRAVYELKRVED
ncbi:MAG: TIGR04076 family protein [Acidobacteriia bacterium]|nr:TIGR04076 family protein [Terriglobia bacterium]